MLFFFKQKTAYDMRISDWSSDVCSSDLVTMTQECCSPSHSTSKPSALKAATMRSAEPLPWLKYTLSSVTTRLLQPVLLTTIGSASCRDSVWPSVYISMVAVSLKNQNTKNLSTRPTSTTNNKTKKP